MQWHSFLFGFRAYITDQNGKYLANFDLENRTSCAPSNQCNQWVVSVSVSPESEPPRVVPGASGRERAGRHRAMTDRSGGSQLTVYMYRWVLALCRPPDLARYWTLRPVLSPRFRPLAMCASPESLTVWCCIGCRPLAMCASPESLIVWCCIGCWASSSPHFPEVLVISNRRQVLQYFADLYHSRLKTSNLVDEEI